MLMDFNYFLGRDPPMMITGESDEESDVKLIEPPESTLNVNARALPTILEEDESRGLNAEENESRGLNADDFESGEDFWKAKYPDLENASDSQLQSRSQTIEIQRQEAHQAMTSQADRMLQASNSR